MLFEIRRHRVVPAVEVAEQRDGGHDLDDLAIIEVPAQLGEILRRRFVRHQRRPVRQPQRSTLGVAEQSGGLELPHGRNLFIGAVIDTRQVGHMRLAVAAAGGLAGDEADEHLQFLGHRALVQHRLVQGHEGRGNRRTPRHGQDAVRDESACARVMREALGELRHGLARQWCHMGHCGFSPITMTVRLSYPKPCIAMPLRLAVAPRVSWTSAVWQGTRSLGAGDPKSCLNGIIAAPDLLAICGT